MNCREFQRHLEAFVGGTLVPGVERDLHDHLRACAHCREMERLVRQSLLVPEVAPPDDLTAAILDRTSGSPCVRSRELLCDYTDGRLGQIDTDLVRLHLETCDGCRAIAVALALLAEDLPAMARLSPGEDFVADVVASTVPAPVVETPKPSWWERLVERPRLAWETAYVGAFVLWIVFSLPIPAVRAVPEKALSFVTGNPVETLREPTTELGRGLWGATGAKGVETVRNVKTGIVERYARTGEARDDVRRHGTELGEAVKTLDLDGTLDAVDGIRKGAGSVLRRFTETDDETNDAGSDPGAC